MARSSRRKKRVAARSPKQLFELAQRRIGNRDGKAALELLRKARFQGARKVMIEALAYRAYDLLAHDLAARGLSAQAGKARAKAARLAPAFHRLVPTPGLLVNLLRSLDDEACFALYARYLQAKGQHREAEAHLADRLVLRRCWKLAEQLDGKSRIGADARAMAAALPDMDAAKWGAARRKLRSLESGSAFGPWDAFAAAMDAFTRDDLQESAQWLRRIPQSFPLQSSLKVLRTAIRPGKSAGAPLRPELRRLFGLDRVAITESAQALRRSVAEMHSAARTAKAISAFAKSLDPARPAELAEQIAFGLQIGMDDSQLTLDHHWTVLFSLGSENLALHRIQKAYVQALALSPPELNDADEIAEFLDGLQYEFPDREEREIARSRILFRLSKAARAAGPWDMDERTFEALYAIAGSEESDGGSRHQVRVTNVAAALLQASVTADPSNAEAHKGLVEILQRARGTRKAELLAASEAYAEAVPEDPEPWLNLAQMRLEQNAYRKAQEALAKARAHAGELERITELQVASSLIAVVRNAQGKRWKRAELDVREAEEAAAGDSVPVVRAYTGLLSFGRNKSSKLHLACRNAVQDCGPVASAQALCLALAVSGRRYGPFSASKRKRRPLRQMADAAIQAVCRDRPHQLLRLVEPLPASFRSVAPPEETQAQLEAHWPRILKSVPDQTLFGVLHVAAECRAWKAIRAELPKRLPRARSVGRRRLLMLHLLSARYVLNEDSDGSRFRKFQDSIPEQELGPVRDEAEQLAAILERRWVLGLALALRTFRFDILDESGIPFF